MAISCITTLTATFQLETKTFTFQQQNEDVTRYDDEILECAKLANFDVRSVWTQLSIKPKSLFLLRTPLNVTKTEPNMIRIDWTSNKLIFLNKPSFENWEDRLRKSLERKLKLMFVQSDFSATETAELEILYAINDALKSIPLYSGYEAASSKIGNGRTTFDVRPLMKEECGDVAMRWKEDNVIPTDQM